MIENDIENSGYFPLQEDILNLVKGATLNDNGDTFFRVIIASNLAQIAGAMRAEIVDALGERTMLNLYVCGTMPSGSGKSQAQNKILDDITQGFKTVLQQQILPRAHDKKVEELARVQVLAGGQVTTPNTTSSMLIKAARQPIEDEYKSYGSFLWRMSGGTEAAIRQERKKIQLQGCGALNVFVDEIGYNLISNQALNVLGLCLYDNGKIEASITKVTKENSRYPERDIPIPVNFLWMGDPTKLFDSSETEKAFMEFLASGYARRTLFGIGGAKTSTKDAKPEDILNMRKTAYAPQLRDNITRTITQLANYNLLNTEIALEEPELLYLYEYEIWCKKRVDDISPISDNIYRIELGERMYKVLKLAGIYAFIDSSPKITKEHLLYAMKLAEDSGRALHTMLHPEEPYIKLAKYLSTTDEPKSRADISEALPFFKNARYQNELLDRAGEWAYNHDIAIKTICRGKLEFFKGERMNMTSEDRLYLSISTDIAHHYENRICSINRLKDLGNIDGWNWCVHHLTYDPSEPANGNCRKDECVRGPFNLLVLDLDDGDSLEFIQEVFEKYKYVLHTTKRHTDDFPRCRVILPIKYELRLDKADYANFMDNVYDSLPFKGIDTATKDRARKWATNKGLVIEHLNGKLFDPRPYIPNTTENEIRRDNLKKYGNMDKIQRWFLTNIGEGNRNNMLIRYGFMLRDQGLLGLELEEAVLTLNQKLENPLSIDEIRSTILKSLKV